MTNIFFYNIMASGIAFIIVITVTLIFPALARRKELEVGSFSSSVGGLGKKMTNGWKNIHRYTTSKLNNDDSRMKTIKKAPILPTVSVEYKHNLVFHQATKNEQIVRMETVKSDANSLAYRRKHHKGEQRHHQQPESVPWRKVCTRKHLDLAQMKHFLRLIRQRLREIQATMKKHENFPYHRYNQTQAQVIFKERAGWGWALMKRLHEINDVLTAVLLDQGYYQRAFGKAVWEQIHRRIYSLINKSMLTKATIEDIYRRYFPEHKQFTLDDVLRDHRQYEKTRRFRLQKSKD